jgi:hypothetical protein
LSSTTQVSHSAGKKPRASCGPERGKLSALGRGFKRAMVVAPRRRSAATLGNYARAWETVATSSAHVMNVAWKPWAVIARPTTCADSPEGLTREAIAAELHIGVASVYRAGASCMRGQALLRARLARHPLRLGDLSGRHLWRQPHAHLRPVSSSTSLKMTPDLRMALMRSTIAASTWINHWPRSRCMGHRAAPLGSVEAMAS